MWREIDDEDIVATLSRLEVEAFQQSADFAAEPVRRLFQRTAAMVRDACRSNGNVRLSPQPYAIPEGCISKAADYLAVDILKRFDLNVSEPRAKARETAERYFESIAKGDITPESYMADPTGQTGGPAVELVSSYPDRVDHLTGL